MTLILLSGQIEYKKYSGLSVANVQYIWEGGGREIPDILSVLFGVCTQVGPSLV